jgi:hypothetical protein
LAWAVPGCACGRAQPSGVRGAAAVVVVTAVVVMLVLVVVRRGWR